MVSLRSHQPRTRSGSPCSTRKPSVASSTNGSMSSSLTATVTRSTCASRPPRCTRPMGESLRCSRTSLASAQTRRRSAFLPATTRSPPYPIGGASRRSSQLRPSQPTRGMRRTWCCSTSTTSSRSTTRADTPSATRFFASSPILLQGLVRGGDFLARLSGDEFALIINELPPEAAVPLVERLLEVVRDYRLYAPDGMFDVTLSAGIYSLQASDTEELALRSARTKRSTGRRSAGRTGSNAGAQARLR